MNESFASPTAHTDVLTSKTLNFCTDLTSIKLIPNKRKTNLRLKHITLLQSHAYNKLSPTLEKKVKPKVGTLVHGVSVL